MMRGKMACLVVSALLVTTLGVGAGPAHASGNTWYDRYAAMDAALGDSVSANSATLAWSESYRLRSYLDVYRLTRDTAWLDRLVGRVDAVVAGADDIDNDGFLGWSTSRYSPPELANTGFETATSGDSTMAANWVRWQTTSANAHRTTDHAAGSYAIQIDSDGQLWRKVYQRLGAYEPNTVYDLRFSAKTNGSDARGRIYVIDQTADVILCSATVTNTAWAASTVECRSPAAAGHTLEVWLGHDNYRVAGGRAYFDDVSISARVPYMVHDGMVGSTIAQFVRLAQRTPSLPDRYREKAAAYRAFLETEIVPRWESSAYLGNSWVSSAGTYRQPPNVDTFAHTRPSPDHLPFNQSLAYAQMLLALYQVNGNATYLARARGVATYFRNALTLTGDRYVWHYAPYSSGIEDTSHANIDVGAAREFYEAGQVFTATDMQRFTNSLTKAMWNGSLTAPVVRRNVDGTGDDSYSIYLVEWAEYAQWAKDILPIVAEQYRNQTGNSPYTMLALSRIMKWDRSKVVNQGFELATSFDATQPAQWNRIGSTASTAFRDSANAFEGTYGLTIRSVAGAAQQVNQTWEGWRPASRYTLTFTGKATGAAGGRVRVVDETTGATLADVTFTDIDWTTTSVELTSPAASGDVARVYIGNADPAAAGTAHVDAISLRVSGDAW
ncbi:hypothetical protein Vau01_051250 [Virgisporangium aurantiacum]|uniref:CBM-cenC domain-containing protein n=2 Tax=Virgisporangium aurantiacum TaxID=175570 RepID=A0A8J4E144_9ACTN|nr:hypothetical protein Vau01_051250 [Virgisporangium aurantiacum]